MMHLTILVIEEQSNSSNNFFLLAILLINRNAVVGKLLDQPGLVNETVDDIIGGLPNFPQKMNECERNEATFKAFQLNRLVNFSDMLDIQAYPELDDEIQQIFVSPKSSFATVTEPLDAILAHMFTISEISLVSYRAELSGEETQKDLGAFIEQMQRISVHTDTATSSRMSSLGNRARRVLSNVMQVYKYIDLPHISFVG